MFSISSTPSPHYNSIHTLECLPVTNHPIFTYGGFLHQPLLCPVFGQSVLSGLYVLSLYLTGIYKLATTACVPCSVLAIYSDHYWENQLLCSYLQAVPPEQSKDSLIYGYSHQHIIIKLLSHCHTPCPRFHTCALLFPYSLSPIHGQIHVL